jgi:tetratricopeptide (TPR) repeat protein
MPAGRAPRRISGRLDDALACFAQALRLRSHYAEALHNRGETLRRRGKLAAAAPSLRQALRLTPNNTSIQDLIPLFFSFSHPHLIFP